MVSKVGSVMVGSAATSLTSQAYQTTHTAIQYKYISVMYCIYITIIEGLLIPNNIDRFLMQFTYEFNIYKFLSPHKT